MESFKKENENGEFQDRELKKASFDIFPQNEAPKREMFQTTLEPQNNIVNNFENSLEDKSKIKETNISKNDEDTSENDKADQHLIDQSFAVHDNIMKKYESIISKGASMTNIAMNDKSPIKKRNNNVETINPETRPELYVPFNHGWKRQVVYRATSVSTKRADIYYFSPSGHKCRSNPDVVKYLCEHNIKNVTIDNFSFIPKPIHQEPFEEVRQALKRSSGENSTPSPKLKKALTTKPKSETSPCTPKKTRTVTKEKSRSTPENKRVKQYNTNNSYFVKSFKPFSPKPPSPSLPKTKAANSILYKSKKMYKKDSILTFLKKQNKFTLDKHNLKEQDINGIYMCSLFCPNAENIVPSLPCSYCFTLFHPRCVKDLLTSKSKKDEDLFLCKPCLYEALKSNPIYTKENILFLKKDILNYLINRNKITPKIAKLETIPSPMSIIRMRGVNRVPGVPLLKHGLQQQTVYPKDFKHSLCLPPLVKFGTPI